MQFGLFDDDVPQSMGDAPSQLTAGPLHKKAMKSKSFTVLPLSIICIVLSIGLVTITFSFSRAEFMAWLSLESLCVVQRRGRLTDHSNTRRCAQSAPSYPSNIGQQPQQQPAAEYSRPHRDLLTDREWVVTTWPHTAWRRRRITRMLRMLERAAGERTRGSPEIRNVARTQTRRSQWQRASVGDWRGGTREVRSVLVGLRMRLTRQRWWRISSNSKYYVCSSSWVWLLKATSCRHSCSDSHRTLGLNDLNTCWFHLDNV